MSVEVTDELEWQIIAGWIESAPETFALVLDSVAGAVLTMMHEQVRQVRQRSET